MSAQAMIKSVRGIFHGGVVVGGAFGLTLAFFLVLPLMQTIAHKPPGDMIVRTVDVANLPPPPPPPEEKPEEEEKEQEQPPELVEDIQPLDLSQLELALNPGFGDGMLGGDFAVKLNTEAGGANTEALFSMADLDQPPRAIFQRSPAMTPQTRKRAPGTVYIIFVVDQRGKVENPIVQSSTDPVFEAPALAAIKDWKFEPGKRNGQPVKFRMRVPITFPKD